MKTYICTDGNADLEIDANSASEAAQEYVDGGDWGEDTKTWWIDILCTPLDNNSERLENEAVWITITVEPDEPDCIDKYTKHNWQAPIQLVGGIESNPGVSGHGGGVVCQEICVRCGCAQTTDSWAQRRDTGEQGLHSIEYDSDDTSLADYLDQLVTGDLDQTQIGEGDNWSIFLAFDSVTEWVAVVYEKADAAACSRGWYRSEIEARGEADKIVDNMRRHTNTV